MEYQEIFIVADYMYMVMWLTEQYLKMNLYTQIPTVILIFLQV